MEGGVYLADHLSDSDIVELHKTIGNFIIQFPMLHCEECASELKRWLIGRNIPGKLWRLSTLRDDEDFILSNRLGQQGCLETITENGVHYGVEVYGKIFDNLSSEGWPPKLWLGDFESLSNEFELQVIDSF